MGFSGVQINWRAFCYYLCFRAKPFGSGCNSTTFLNFIRPFPSKLREGCTINYFLSLKAWPRGPVPLYHVLVSTYFMHPPHSILRYVYSVNQVFKPVASVPVPLPLRKNCSIQIIECCTRIIVLFPPCIPLLKFKT